ncbi:MAG: ABC transporter permease [Bacteroidia bacterium]
MKRKIISIILGLLPLTVFLLLWQFVISTTEKKLFLFSSPSKVFHSLIENISNGILPRDIFITGQEAIYGFLIGNICGAAIGLSLWYSKRVADLTRPYIIAIGAIPIFSIAPMMIMWFGTGMYAKVIMAALSTVVIAITQSYEGARQVDVQQIKLFHSFGASRTQIFSKLIVPSSLVWLFNSLKLNISFALLGAFIAEFISAHEGLGHRVFKAGGTYDVSLVLAAVICIILLALLFSRIIYLFEKTLLKWK